MVRNVLSTWLANRPGLSVSSCRIDDGNVSLVKAFENATGHDKGRCVINKDLGLSSVGTL
jgi:hypothetical protein